MRMFLTNRIPGGTASLLHATIILMLISAAIAIAAPPIVPRPLPPQVLSSVPEIHPFGKGRHSLFGIPMYDATLWIVGPQWSEAAPHALDIEPSRAVSSDLLVKNAIVEMRNLKVGDESKLRTWQAELKKIIPNLKPGDQVVIFCTETNRTLGFLNDSNIGEIDDPSFCPALMSVWLHPQTKHQSMRKSLLRN